MSTFFNIGSNKAMIRISDSEWKIMSLLWEKEPKTITQITKELYDETAWTKHTVITLLKRMENKGLIRHDEGERAKQYYSVTTRQEAVNGEKDSFLNKVFKGNIPLMVSTFIEQDELSDEEIKELIGILKEKKGKRDDADN